MFDASNDLYNNMILPVYVKNNHTGTDVLGNVWQIDINNLNIGNCKVVFILRVEGCVKYMSFAEAQRRGFVPKLSSSLSLNNDYAITATLRKLRYANWINVDVLKYYNELLNHSVVLHLWNDFIIYFSE